MALREKSVLAKQTHLTPMLDKTKSRRLHNRPDAGPDRVCEDAALEITRLRERVPAPRWAK